MEDFNLELLIDDYNDDDIHTDNSIDEEELNNFLMGDVLAGTKKKSKKVSYADRFAMKILRKKRKREGLAAKKKRKKKRKNASHTTNMAPELEKLMQEATDCYLDKNIDEAVKKLKELVRRAPGLHDPFHMLGVIYQEEYKDINTATSYYLLAAHLVPTDIDLWQRIGEMSQEIGNIDQAIYCFKKCLKDHYDEINEQVYFALTICYLEKEDYRNAIRRLSVLYKLHPEDFLLATELSRCLESVGDKNASLVVLMTYYKITCDVKVLDRICKLHMSLELYKGCFELMEHLMDSNGTNTSGLTVDLLVYYVISAIYLNKSVDTELDILWNSGLDAGTIFSISNSLSTRSSEESIKWFKKGFDSLKSPSELDCNIAIKISKLVVSECGDHQFAINVLKYILPSHPKNSELLITLADILSNTGDVNQAEEILANITLDEFDKLNKDMPMPIDEYERECVLRRLYNECDELLYGIVSDVGLRVYPCLLSYGRVTYGIKDVSKVNMWIDDFLRIVNDCEMDMKRASKHLNDVKLKTHSTKNDDNTQGDTNSIFITNDSTKRTNSNKNYSFNKMKKELGLKSAEDLLGWECYEELIVSATVLMVCVGRYYEILELLELISNNKKRYKSNLSVNEKRRLIKTVEELSFQTSLYAEVFKIGITYARNEFLKSPTDGNLKCYSRILCTGKIAQAALLPLSSSNEKDVLLENRSWISRQLISKPNNFELLMLAGHFSTISGNWNYAINEYKRALAQKPNESVTNLCLAISYLNSTTRKYTNDTSSSVVLGMAFIQRYVKLRREYINGLSIPDRCKEVFMVESCYNLARTFHMLRLLDIAMKLYDTCITMLNDLDGKYFKEEFEEVSTECPCIVCDYCRKRDWDKLPHSSSKYSIESFIWNHNRKELLKMPNINIGDLIEVKYELSRTQQTFAIFQGYCIDIRKRGLNSSFSLKNAFDGVGVTQMIPYYSPRILNVKVMKSIIKRNENSYTNKPLTRDYRYRFHLNVRHRFSKKSGVHKPGIRSFEIRLKNRISRLKLRYYQMRLEANLPPYIWGGPYNINNSSRQRRRLVRGEMYRRIKLYSLDEERSRAEKLHKRREKTRWGNYKLPGLSYLNTLDKTNTTKT